MSLIKEIENYIPWNWQEEQDKKEFLRRLGSGENLYTRDNLSAHLTASAWVVSPDRSRVLMAYHNLYDSWAWLGGHADGERDLLVTAMREVSEESGLPVRDGSRDGKTAFGKTLARRGETDGGWGAGLDGFPIVSGALRPVSRDIYSLEILTVNGHEKRGKYVPSHLHFNVTYLLEADPSLPVRCKPDENSRVAWFRPEEAIERSTEPWIRERIYKKLNEKLSRF